MPAEAPILVIRQKGRPERRLPLAPGSFGLGRSEDNEICLPDLGVSRRHARITVTDSGEVTLEDLGSGNGVWYHGRRVEARTVTDGDEFKVEPFVLRFELPAPPEQETLRADPGRWTGRDPNEHTDVLPDALPDAVEAQPPPANIEHIGGPEPSGSWIVPPKGLTLGRGSNQDVVMRDSAASRSHAAIKYREGQYWLEDTRSANGVYLNNERLLQSTALRDGDIFRIGETGYMFSVDEDPSYYDAPDQGDPYADAPPDRTEMFSGVLDQDAPNPFSSMPTRPPNPNPFAPTFSSPPAAPDAQPGAPTPFTPSVSRPPQRALDQPVPPANPPNPFASGPSAPDPGLAFAAPTNTSKQEYQAMAEALSGPGHTLGEAPIEGGFGAPEMAVGGQKKKKGPLSRPINQLTLLILLGVVGAVGYKQFGQITPPTRGGGGQDSAEIVQLMDDGMIAFQVGQYYEASGKFLGVLQIDPDHEAAERMGYLSVEFITIQAMRTALELKAESVADRGQRKADALAAAAEARGSRKLGEARDLLERALQSIPGDPELQEALDGVNAKLRRIANAQKDQDLAALTADAKAAYDRGQAALTGKDFNAAIAEFQKVAGVDPDDATGYLAKAEAGIASAHRGIAVGTRAIMEEGERALASGDNYTARAKFRAVLAKDPNNASARTKLAQAQKHIAEAALVEFQSGVVMEEANQVGRAIQKYQKAIEIIDDSSHSIHKNAQNRINRLVE